MGDSTSKMVMDWYSDASKALTDMQAIIGKQDAIIKGLKETNREAKASREAFTNIKGAAGEILGLVGVGGGIAGGISFLKTQSDAWLETVKKTASEYIKVNAELIKSIGLSGDLANMGEVRGRLQKLSMPGVTLAERGQIYQSISGEMPGASMEQRLALTQQAAAGKLLYGDAAKFGRQVAAVADLYGGNLSAEDSADVAAAVAAGLGANADKLGEQVAKSATKLTASGMAPDTSLAIAIAAGKAEQIREFGSIADLLTKSKNFEPEIDPRTGKRRTVSDTEKIEKEFYGLGAQDRWSWLMANRQEGGKAWQVTQDAGALNAIAGEDISGIAAGLENARAQNLLQKNLRAALQGAGMDVQNQYKLDVIDEQATMELGRQNVRTQQAAMLREVAYKRARASGVPQALIDYDRFAANSAQYLGGDPIDALKDRDLTSGYLSSLEIAMIDNTKSNKELTAAIKQQSVGKGFSTHD